MPKHILITLQNKIMKKTYLYKIITDKNFDNKEFTIECETILLKDDIYYFIINDEIAKYSIPTKNAIIYLVNIYDNNTK